jgi:hypothetical protein
MTIHFKILATLRDQIQRDLRRRHAFAAERVGFISCVPAKTPSGLLIAAVGYHPVADADYLPDRRVGAMMGPAAIRKALQFAYNHPVSMFHVHLHDHCGSPGFSGTDFRETQAFVPDFFKVQASLPHGALVLSQDSAVARCWRMAGAAPEWISKITVVGSPLTFIRNLCPPNGFSARPFSALIAKSA